jgi:hypothetical protein
MEQNCYAKQTKVLAIETMEGQTINRPMNRGKDIHQLEHMDTSLVGGFCVLVTK